MCSVIDYGREPIDVYNIRMTSAATELSMNKKTDEGSEKKAVTNQTHRELRVYTSYTYIRTYLPIGVRGIV